jgi:hypothetical protein
MAWRYCDLCLKWIHSEHHKIDPRTRNVLCEFCGTWLRGNIDDEMYLDLVDYHRGKVPPPESHASGGEW